MCGVACTTICRSGPPGSRQPEEHAHAYQRHPFHARHEEDLWTLDKVAEILTTSPHPDRCRLDQLLDWEDKRIALVESALEALVTPVARGRDRGPPPPSPSENGGWASTRCSAGQFTKNSAECFSPSSVQAISNLGSSPPITNRTPSRLDCPG